MTEGRQALEACKCHPLTPWNIATVVASNIMMAAILGVYSGMGYSTAASCTIHYALCKTLPINCSCDRNNLAEGFDESTLLASNCGRDRNMQTSPAAWLFSLASFAAAEFLPKACTCKRKLVVSSQVRLMTYILALYVSHQYIFHAAMCASRHLHMIHDMEVGSSLLRTPANHQMR